VVNRPALLIADEPTANLDAAAAAAIMEIFASFNQVGVTVLVSTHDEALMRTLCQARAAACQREHRALRAHT
jgi:cell division transport system ATP-binding protein